MITHIHSATLVVSDQDKAIDFYVGTLGWEKTADTMMGPDMRWVTVAPAGATTNIALATPAWFGDQFKPGVWSGISLVATDIQATYDDLKAKGVAFKGPLEPMPWGDQAATMLDPDGNELFLSGS